MEIPDLSAMNLEAQVDEVDGRYVEAGDAAEIEFDAFPDRSFKGHVTRMVPFAKRKRWDQPFKVFDVVVEVDEVDEKIMRPGMRAKARIVVEKYRDVISIPEEAIVEEEGEHYVYVSGGSGPEKRRIEPGKRSENRVLIEKGLEDGEFILLGKPAGA